jgi:hypothetical protein
VRGEGERAGEREKGDDKGNIQRRRLSCYAQWYTQYSKALSYTETKEEEREREERDEEDKSLHFLCLCLNELLCGLELKD